MRELNRIYKLWVCHTDSYLRLYLRCHTSLIFTKAEISNFLFVQCKCFLLLTYILLSASEHHPFPPAKMDSESVDFNTPPELPFTAYGNVDKRKTVSKVQPFQREVPKLSWIPAFLYALNCRGVMMTPVRLTFPL